MTTRAPRDEEAGFLLADMLATMTISAFVLVGLVGLGPLLLRTVDRSVAAIDASDDFGRTLISLDHLVRSANRARLDGAATQPFLFHGDEHRVVVASRGRGNDGRVTRAVSLRSDPDGRLYRAEASLPALLAAADDLRFGPPHLIYAGPTRFRFAYQGPPAAARTDGSPVPLWPVGDRMPVAVVIEAVDVATGRVVASLRSTIAADTDIGCLAASLCGRDDLPGRSAAASPNPGATP